MYRTAWTQKHSSLPSDRIAPPSRPVSSQSTKGKGRNSNSDQGPPKSKEVKRLQSLLSALKDAQSPKKEPKGGCFCQAREHPLSPYTPICQTCGLILCNINQPHFACPHCLTSLIPGNLRNTLISRLQVQLDETVAKEVAARERAIEAAKQQAGAFPTLYGAAPPAKLIVPQPQTHKVLSVNSKSKKVLLSSYTSTPASSRPASRSETEDEEAAIARIPPPSAEVPFARSSVDPTRPWSNLLNGNPEYVALPIQAGESASRKGRKGKNNNKASVTQAHDATALGES
ncbi:hypothetical protein GGU10DRAFT_268821 [Lentinula aff. detonsa]|uniref:TRIP4/RQT4 C2HC5-type zinc finger domain-containing protein n=1 Tax=Lentinula aff. detonsa TaxID=2804958 RepID=A0AA38NPM1_9AGAR|nr:hypothetical protein GGU10DRAFT_268821 [Lentinula aff. detonsa]